MINAVTQYCSQYFSTLVTGLTAHQVQERDQLQVSQPAPIAPENVAAAVESLRESFEEGDYQVSPDVVEKLDRDLILYVDTPTCLSHSINSSPDLRCPNVYDCLDLYSSLNGCNATEKVCKGKRYRPTEIECHQIACALLKSRIERRPCGGAEEVRFPASNRKYYRVSKESMYYFLPAYPGNGVELVSRSQAEKEGVPTPETSKEYSIEIQKKSAFRPGSRDVTRTFYVISDEDSTKIRDYDKASLDLLEGALLGAGAPLTSDIGSCAPAEMAALKTRMLAKIIAGFALATLTCLGALYFGISTLSLARTLVVASVGEGPLTFAYNVYWVVASLMGWVLIGILSNGGNVHHTQLDFFPKLIEAIGHLGVWIIQQMARLTPLVASHVFGQSLTIPTAWSLAGRVTLTTLYAAPVLIGIAVVIFAINDVPLTSVYDQTVRSLASAPRAILTTAQRTVRATDRLIGRFL